MPNSSTPGEVMELMELRGNRMCMLSSVSVLLGDAMRLLILLTVFAVGSLMADPVLSFNTSTAGSSDNFNETVGWEFNVLSTVTVTGLGWFDPQLAHDVGIWDSKGDLLGSAVVAAGATDPLDGLFHTKGLLTPIILSPGEYIVGGQNFCGPLGFQGCLNNNTEQLAFGVTPTTDPRISFVQGVFSSGSAFEFPNNPTGTPDCCWGPSFSVAADAAVPEPADASPLLAIGILAAALLARRRHPA